MKLEKREISLNEVDSLRDACLIEKTLLHAYVDAMEKAQRKETRKQLVKLLEETGEDLYFVCDLLNSKLEENNG